MNQDFDQSDSENDVQRRTLKVIQDRIVELMAAKRTNASRLAKKAKLGSTAVYDILNNKNKNPSDETLSSIAAELGCTIDYISGRSDDMNAPAKGGLERRGVLPIPIIGMAEAGAFRPMLDFDTQSHELPSIDGPAPRHYQQARRFALKVMGDSMNAARPYPLIEGMHVLCIDMADANLMIESGKIYAVRRTLDGGQTYECAIKRAMVFRDRIELVSETTKTTDPRYAKIIVPNGSDEMGQTSFEAIGLVYATYNSYED